MRWLRLIAGPQPVLRLIALLLAVIAFLLLLIQQDVRSIWDSSEPCGSSGDPCSVVMD